MTTKAAPTKPNHCLFLCMCVCAGDRGLHAGGVQVPRGVRVLRDAHVLAGHAHFPQGGADPEGEVRRGHGGQGRPAGHAHAACALNPQFKTAHGAGPGVHGSRPRTSASRTRSWARWGLTEGCATRTSRPSTAATCCAAGGAT